MKYLAACSLAAVLLGACDTTDKDVARAQEAVKATLKDPESATFKELRKFSEGVVCGQVNAKNSYGAMAGFEEFIFGGRSDSDVVMAKDVKPRDVALFCSDQKNKRLAFKRRELHRFELWCEGDTNYEESCAAAAMFRAEVKRLSEAMEAGTAQAPASAASSSGRDAAEPVMLFGQFPLGGRLKMEKCPKTYMNPGKELPCVNFEHQKGDRITSLVTPAAGMPSWADVQGSIQVEKSAGTERVLLVRMNLEIQGVDAAARILDAMSERFGEPDDEGKASGFAHRKWDLPTAFVSVRCVSKSCTLQFETSDEHRRVVQERLAKRGAAGASSNAL